MWYIFLYMCAPYWFGILIITLFCTYICTACFKGRPTYTAPPLPGRPLLEMAGKGGWRWHRAWVGVDTTTMTPAPWPDHGNGSSYHGDTPSWRRGTGWPCETWLTCRRVRWLLTAGLLCVRRQYGTHGAGVRLWQPVPDMACESLPVYVQLR